MRENDEQDVNLNIRNMAYSIQRTSDKPKRAHTHSLLVYSEKPTTFTHTETKLHHAH